uniref:Alternative protein CHD7 n=1 Tax=Homo sapiens TaxID=9606 RepID=L8E8D7_HUMAN|nr:alternative protein CHD7 [Homo sapiens]
MTETCWLVLLNTGSVGRIITSSMTLSYPSWMHIKTLLKTEGQVIHLP